MIYLELEKIQTKTSNLLDPFLNNTENNLIQITKDNCKALKEIFIKSIAQLQALSPLATLTRGYAIVSQNKAILKGINKLDIASPIDVRLSDGILSCKVIKKTAVQNL